jgi:5-(carboxyamino)imidazole ribonucleotide mutase
MVAERIVVLVGSASDMSFAHRVEDFLHEASFPVRCEYRVSSAHRNAEKLLNDLKSYEKSEYKIVYITMAGLSDALSGVVAGYSRYPVIACPPDIEKHGFSKVFSTMMTPQGVAVSLVSTPENAALAAVKILALSNSSLQDSIYEYVGKMRNAVAEADIEVKGKKAHEREREHLERIEHREPGEHVEHTEDI